MGYEIHLTKAGDGSEDAEIFTEKEWEGIIRHENVKEWLYFQDGRITVKNPTAEQLIALVKFSKNHGWEVHGDDGERYSENGLPIEEKPAQKETSLSRALLRFLRNIHANRQSKKRIQSSIKGFICPFKVGDKVRTSFRTGGVVIEVDKHANHGMGSIKIKFPDGQIIGSAFIGSDLEMES